MKNDIITNAIQKHGYKTPYKDDGELLSHRLSKYPEAQNQVAIRRVIEDEDNLNNKHFRETPKRETSTTMKENQVYRLAQLDRDSMNITGDPMKSHRYTPNKHKLMSARTRNPIDGLLYHKNPSNGSNNYVTPKIGSSVDPYRPWIP
jgi:hypothetical protein